MDTRGNSRSEAEPTAVESLSEAAIKRALRSDAVQHPAAILPFALCALSIVYLVIFSPVLGGALVAIILLVASAVVAAGGFVWQYFIRYTEEYTRRLQVTMELQEQERMERERAELGQLQDVLQSGFSGINSVEDLDAVGFLNKELKLLKNQPIR